MTTPTEPLKDRLIHAYDQMMEQVHALVEQASENVSDLQEYIEEATDKIAELDNITREEAEQIADYLRRDLHNAGEYLEESSHDMAGWLDMDIELIEWKLTDLFLQVADKTKLDLLLLEENSKHVNEYRTGEITGVGTLVCDACGEVLHFKHSGHIPPCPKCHATEFTRQSK